MIARNRRFARLAQATSLAALGVFLLSTPAVLPAQDEDPIQQYLEKVKTDEFNLDVKAGKKAEPKRGGRLRIRTPADFQGMNPITITGQPERVVMEHMHDGLIDRDLSTWEDYPRIAWSWRVADIVKEPGKDPVYGRIIAQDDTSITFVPGAWTYTVGKVDVVDGANVAPGQGSITLVEARGGATITGTIRKRPNTLIVDMATDPELAKGTVTLAISALDTWEDKVGESAKKRPFAKRECAFEFNIRDGVKWHDGTPFTAEDVKFTFDVIMNPFTDSDSIRSTFKDFEAAEVFNDGKSIRVIWGKPYFAAILAAGFTSGVRVLLPKHIFKPETFGGDQKAFGEFFKKHQYNESPIMLGAYKMKGWQKGNQLTIERNEEYWGSKLPAGSLVNWNPQQPYLDEISWVYIKDASASIKELEAGAIHADLDVEPDNWVQPSTNTDDFKSKITRAERLGFLYTYIGWNLTLPMFADRDTRRALAMLIPRDEIASKIHQDLAFPVTGPFYVKSPAYDKSTTPLPYDPTQAKRLLRRAGWADRDGDGVLDKEIDGKKVDFQFSYMIHNARDYHQKIADIIKEKVEEANIRVTIDKLDWTIFSDTVRDKKFQSVRFAWSNQLDPDPYLIWHSSQIEGRGDNFVSYRNPRVDELCEKMREEFDPIKRWEMAREIHRIIYEDQPYCFLFGFTETYFINRGIQGVSLYPSYLPHNFSEWFWAGTPPESAASRGTKQGG